MDHHTARLRHTTRLEEAGFTLIEIAIAVLVLAGSLVVLLGLQSSALTRTYRDEQALRAMQGARIVLAGIESSQIPLEDGTTSSGLLELMKTYSDVDPQDKELLPFENLQGTLKIEPFGIGILKEKTMKRVTLRVTWGESSLDALEIFYISPTITE